MVLDKAQVLREVVVLARRPLGQGTQVAQDLHGAIQFALALPCGTRPRGIEVPLFQEPVHRTAQCGAGATRVAGVAAPKRAPHAGRRVGERTPEPAFEGDIAQSPGLVVGGHAERGVHAGLHRPLPQKIRAKAVNRPNVREFQLLQRTAEVVAIGPRLRLGARPLDLAAQSELHLAGGLFGERDRHDVVERAAPALQHLDDAVHERGRLPRPGCGLNEERVVEIVPDRVARRLVGQPSGPPHRDFLRRRSSTGAGLRRMRRSSSGPHTAR